MSPRFVAPRSVMYTDVQIRVGVLVLSVLTFVISLHTEVDTVCAREWAVVLGCGGPGLPQVSQAPNGYGKHPAIHNG